MAVGRAVNPCLVLDDCQDSVDSSCLLSAVILVARAMRTLVLPLVMFCVHLLLLFFLLSIHILLLRVVDQRGSVVLH